MRAKFFTTIHQIPNILVICALLQRDLLYTHQQKLCPRVIFRSNYPRPQSFPHVKM